MGEDEWPAECFRHARSMHIPRPRWQCAIEIIVGAAMMELLIEDVTMRVTLTGDSVTIGRAYERDFHDRLEWCDVAVDWAGKATQPAWVVSRDVLLHMRELKRERGIDRYRGIPLRCDGEDGRVSVRWEEIAKLTHYPMIKGIDTISGPMRH